MRIALIPALAAALFLSIPTVQAAADEPARLVVTGTGSAAGEPDRITVSVGVTTVSETAEDALARNSQDTAKVIGTIKAAGIRDRAIQTVRFDVIPVFSNPSSKRIGPIEEPQIVGYRVQHSLSIEADDTGKLSAILDKTVKAGANGIGQIRFSIADPAPLRDEALGKAVEDARRKAERMAEAAGVKLGAILAIHEGAEGPSYPSPVMAEARMSAPPIQAGETSVSAVVTVIWSIAE